MKKIKVLFVLCALVTLSGCAVISIHDPSTNKVAFRVWAPAWPWQDSTDAIKKLNISSRTNHFTASLANLDATQTTSSNAVALIESAVGAAVTAAVKAAKP